MSAEQTSLRSKRKRSRKERLNSEHARKKSKISSNGNHWEQISTGDAAAAQSGTAGKIPATQNQRRADGGPSSAPAVQSLKLLDRVDKKSKKKQKTKQVSALKEQKVQWHLTEPVGGHIMDIDPIMSQDERYLFIASQRALHVYSVATSLLARTLPSGSGEIISGYTLSTVNPEHMYVATSTGLVMLWDWTSGQKIARWETGVPVNTMMLSSSRTSRHDIVYTLHRAKNSTITTHSLRSGDDAAKTSSTIVLRLKETIQEIRVLGQGSTIVASFSNKVMIGQRSNAPKADEDAPKYVWRELKVPEMLTCFDARTRSTSGSNAQTEQLDLAVGSVRGEIFVYEDIINKMIAAEKSSSKLKSNSTAPRILHWHRTALGAVRWALDGNYIVSGGQEGVLAMWQLTTGKRQDLPHLTSPVQSITVTSSSAAYAIRLADNSVMVLSTTDLKPKANVAWIQSQIAAAPGVKADISRCCSIPAVINPRKASEMLLAVPTSQTSDTYVRQPFPYLQTYDLNQSRHVSRQAVTRNNATNFMTAPDRSKLLEPDITHIRISVDGNWLATTEEWYPPRKDIENIIAKQDLAEEQLSRREVYLKFWRWTKQKEQWTLETRIDSPHEIPGTVVSGRIYGLAVRPDKLGFASIGEDGVTKLWEPMTKVRNGATFRGIKDGKDAVVTWTCRHAVQLERLPEIQEVEPDLGPAHSPSHGCLAFSPDGSVLAVSQTFQHGPGESAIHFIDADLGHTARSLAPPTRSAVVAMGFTGPHLVLASSRLTVWDLVADSPVYSLALGPTTAAAADLTQPQLGQLHLATHDHDGTFALALATPAAATVFVFNAASPAPLCVQALPIPVTCVLPSRAGKGYVVLDAAAEVRTLSPTTAPGTFVPTPESAIVTAENIDDDGKAAPPVLSIAAAGVHETRAEETDDAGEGQRRAPTRLEYEEEDDKPVVRPEQLAAVFDVPDAHALPPMRELFLAVAQLYGRKPRGRKRDNGVVRVVEAEEEARDGLVVEAGKEGEEGEEEEGEKGEEEEGGEGEEEEEEEEEGSD